MTPHTLLFAAELGLLAFGLGATAWVFFIQTPALLAGLGMARFLPLQMRLVRVFARAMAAAALLLLAVAALRGGLGEATLPAVIAATAAVVNATLIVPRALKAGGQAVRAVRAAGGGDASVGGFVSDGGGEPTRLWHRLVVVAVLAMSGGLVADGVHLLGDHTAAHAAAPHGHAAAPTADARWPADPATVENMHALHAAVRAAQAESAGPDLGAVDAAYRAVFRDCTMEGEAHEALHALLVPVGESLDRAGAPGQAPQALADAEARLRAFDARFVGGAAGHPRAP